MTLTLTPSKSSFIPAMLRWGRGCVASTRYFIDSNAARNFIYQTLARKLGLPIKGLAHPILVLVQGLYSDQSCTPLRSTPRLFGPLGGQGTDCAINLVPGVMPTSGQMFLLSPPEQEAMEEYIREALTMGFI